ncbi:MAG TPA: GatB/YqeY domain-containing protein [Geobacterales bacterium]|jgi:uncharacterized protein YqeY|nr:GatB/YqeY domain-containing protein [Geobacterales bacterium]
MELRQRLDHDMKEAMRGKDSSRLTTIRMVRSVIKNREIELKRELDDQSIIEVIATIVKQRRESIRMFNEGGRADLVAKEEAELAVLQEYLPKQLERSEIEALVLKAIADSGAQGAKDMGKVMKFLMPQVSGRADGKLVNDIVREKLS